MKLLNMMVDLPRPEEPVVPLAVELLPAPSVGEVLERFSGLNNSILFDSALQHPSLGRYSFITADPFELIGSRGHRVSVSTEGAKTRDPADPFTVLAERLARFQVETLPGLPPFQGGAAGLFGYELGRHIERLPRPRYDDFALPEMAVGLFDWVVAFDHQLNRAWAISTGLPMTRPHEREARAHRRLRQVLNRLQRVSPSEVASSMDRPRPSWQPARSFAVSKEFPDLLSNFDRATYLETVRRAIDYIHAGDCFQVNIAQRLLHPATIAPLELYRRLRARNPAPFAGYFDLGEFVIARASPERFLRLHADGEVEARPIKGTRPRGATPAEDQSRIDQLVTSAKDRSENVMIVDLLRNDLGRVCEYGTVRVPAVCRVESYPFVHHLVSEVRGKLRPRLGPIDLLRAAFPGGSVTGAPKIRAMEIIAELEPTARGPYCGCLGWIGFDGGMDANILIRTFTIGRGWVQFPVGGGIVADSVPEQEYEETWHKAEGLLRALA
jgi:para-aminobenzoate synthetase component 1